MLQVRHNTYIFRNRQGKINYKHKYNCFSPSWISNAPALKLGFSDSSFPSIKHLSWQALQLQSQLLSLTVCPTPLIFIIRLTVQCAISLCSNHIIPHVCPSLFLESCLCFFMSVICLFNQVLLFHHCPAWNHIFKSQGLK